METELRSGRNHVWPKTMILITLSQRKAYKGRYVEGGTLILPIWIMSVNHNLNTGKTIAATVMDKLAPRDDPG
jgi:hypothetical protein